VVDYAVCKYSLEKIGEVGVPIGSSVCVLFAFVLEVVLIQNNVTEIKYCFVFVSKQSVLSINVIIFINLYIGKGTKYVTKLCTCYRFEEQHGFISGARRVFERAVEFFGEESMDEKLFIAFAKFEEGQREVHVMWILHTQPCNILSYLVHFFNSPG
jgi:hypothetical protein